MTTVKGLAIVALLLGGTSLAMAQNGPATGGQPPAATPAPPGPGVIPHDAPRTNVQSAAPPTAAAPAATAGPPGPGVNPAPNYGQSTAAPTGAASGTRIAHGTTKQHKKMYMSAKSTRHKGSKLTPSSNAKPQMKQ